MDFSEKLIRLRRSAGLSQEQLADRLGVTRQSVSKWESGSAGQAAVGLDASAAHTLLLGDGRETFLVQRAPELPAWLREPDKESPHTGASVCGLVSFFGKISAGPRSARRPAGPECS